MPTIHVITHPDVVIDPAIPVTDWPLSPQGLRRMHALAAQPWVAQIGSVWSSAASSPPSTTSPASPAPATSQSSATAESARCSTPGAPSSADLATGSTLAPPA